MRKRSRFLYMPMLNLPFYTWQKKFNPHAFISQHLMEPLKYPIGKFNFEEARAAGDISTWISDITGFPAEIASLTADLPDETLEKSYRPEGWTIRQVVHHCADSHMNAFIRFRLSLTEDHPTILPYDQAAWSNLADSRLPVASSIHILAGLHERWSVMLRKMSPEDFARGYKHPEFNDHIFTLEEALALYSWHCRHHLAHIRQAMEA